MIRASLAEVKQSLLYLFIADAEFVSFFNENLIRRLPGADQHIRFRPD